MSDEKKNRPTPKRNAKKITPALAPAATKEAKKAERENARRRRMEMRQLYLQGDERALPKRDKGPVRKFARDYVDSRWSIAEFFLPLLMVVLIFTAMPSVTIKVLATLVMYVVVLIYAALSIGNFYTSLPKLALMGSAALSGFLYVKLLRRGIPIGTWVYDLFSVLEAKTINQKQQALKEMEEKKSALEFLLDKIHESGMESLSAKEKEQLKELSQS